MPELRGRGTRPVRLACNAVFPAVSVAAASSIALRGRYREPFAPVLEQVDIECNHRGGAPVLRVGFVTDTHVGPTVRAADVDRAMALLANSKPQILLFGGDFICESPRFIPEVASAFRDYAHEAPGGALAVFGNHDYANDAPRLQSALEQIGIRVLRNEGALVCANNHRFWIAGIDDAVLGNPDVARAFHGKPAATPGIAIWHEPDWAQQTAALGAMLQLSGHSHGGQIRLPLIGHIAAPSGGRRFVAGLNAVDGMPIYTSRGVGIYRPPIRLLCRPEVTLLSIRAPDGK